MFVFKCILRVGEHGLLEPAESVRIGLVERVREALGLVAVSGYEQKEVKRDGCT